MKRKKHWGDHFLKGSMLVLILSALPIFASSKGDLELSLNQLHQPFLDFLFLALTQLGDGIVFVPMVILFLFRKSSFAIFLSLCGIFNSLFVFIGKRLLFPGVPRPAEFFKDIDFYHVPGLELHHWNSFPSGHTTTAFSLAFALAIIYSKFPKVQRLLLVLAIGIGLSRVYLMQHFFMDIWMGASLGVLSTLAAREVTLQFFSGKKYRRPVFKVATTSISSLRKRIIFQQRLAE